VLTFGIAATAVATLVALPACVDAPISSEHLQPNGELRQAVYERAGITRDQELQQVRRISAVLAAESGGALEDGHSFATDVGTVYLHLRADSLVISRPVIFRWTHDGTSQDVLGVLNPSETLGLAASHPIGQRQAGDWTVEVLGVPRDGNAAPVLFERTFEILAKADADARVAGEPPVPASN
jgi:hypothetical protein